MLYNVDQWSYNEINLFPKMDHDQGSEGLPSIALKHLYSMTFNMNKYTDSLSQNKIMFCFSQILRHRGIKSNVVALVHCIAFLKKEITQFSLKCELSPFANHAMKSKINTEKLIWWPYLIYLFNTEETE